MRPTAPRWRRVGTVGRRASNGGETADADTMVMTGGGDSLTLAEAAQRLGVHYMTAYRYVRTGRLPAAKRGGVWVVATSDLEHFQGAAGTAGAPGTGTYAARLEDRLVHGDEGGSWAVVEEALGSSMTPEGVYTVVVGPAMASIGEKWARGQLAIEDEHMASTIVHRLAGRLGPRFARRGRRRGTIVLGAPAGDAHGLPVMLMADLLRGRGFDVVDLGADTPPAAFARAATGVDRLVAVGICATRAGNDVAIGRAVAALAEATTVPVVLGGQGVDASTETVVIDHLGGEARQLRRSRHTDEAIARFEEATASLV